MTYKNNEQLVIEFKKLLLDGKISQRELANKIGISPQALQNLLNKKQLSFSDMKRILNCVDYELSISFIKRAIDETMERDTAPQGVSNSQE